MLRKFSVQGYKNFRNRVTLDFTKTRHYNFNQECVKDGLISKAILQGRNGCGKTNLGMALFDIVPTLTELMTDIHQKDRQTFLNGYSDMKYAEFTYEFESPAGTIVYKYRKTDPETIIYESFELNGSVIFSRTSKTILSENGRLSDYGAGTLRMNITNERLSALRYIVNNTIQEDDSPLKFVMDFASHMLYFRSTQDGNTFIGLLDGSETATSYLVRNNMVDGFKNFLKETADLDMDLDVVYPVQGMEPILVQKTTGHPLVFRDIASSGTNAMMLFYYWMKHFDGISFLYIDDFDACYHFELSGKILSILEKYDMQVIVTSHNTSLLSSKLTRPDCCLHLENGMVRSFSDSTDMEIRQGHNLEKLYRGGEFDE